MESPIELENWHFSEKMSEQNVLTTLKLKKYGIEEQVKTIPQLAKFHRPKEKCCWEKRKASSRSGCHLCVLYRYTQAFWWSCWSKDLLPLTEGIFRAIFIPFFFVIACAQLWMNQAEKCLQKRIPHGHNWEHFTSTFPFSLMLCHLG